MREIKFRGLGVDGKWWYGESSPIDEFRHVNLAAYFMNLHAGAIRPETNSEYTGLKDKNGTEIYEGDIIKECTAGSVIWDGDGVIEECPTGIVEITPYHTNLQRLKKGRVKVKEGSIVDHYHTGYSELNITTYDGIYQWPEDIEVIGNIHENEDLLK